jgi:parallel beta-helix repeat protein
MEYTYHSPIFIDGDKDFHLQASTNGWKINGSRDGSEFKPYIIRNYEFNESNAIEIHNTSIYFEITNNRVCINNTPSEGQYAFSLFNVNNGKIHNNHLDAHHNIIYGIYLWNAVNNTISNNYIAQCKIGLLLNYSSRNRIINNSVLCNGIGVGIKSSHSNWLLNNSISNSNIGLIFGYFSIGTIIYGNNISECRRTGISGGSIIATNISSNIIFHCGFAIQLNDSLNCTIFYNKLFNNSVGPSSLSSGGLFLYSNTSNIRVSYNQFINNAKKNSTSQSNDDGNNNSFEYNYWNYWTGPDNNGDGIVDYPYVIAGSANNSDPYPLVHPPSNQIPTPYPRTTDFSPLLLLFTSCVFFCLIKRRK